MNCRSLPGPIPVLVATGALVLSAMVAIPAVAGASGPSATSGSSSGETLRSPHGGAEAGRGTDAAQESEGRTGAKAKIKVKIKIKTFRFRPSTLGVAPGTKIVWKNADAIEHTVTSDDGAPVAFDAALPGAKEKFAVTLSEPGTYEYFCARHPSMRGTIVVR